MLYTVQGVDWAGTGNGLLLFLAARRVFDALITVDRGIEHQQKVSNLPMPVIFMLAKRDRLIPTASISDSVGICLTSTPVGQILGLASGVSGFGNVPDLCHIPPILPILQNHTNRRTPTNLPALPKRRALPNRHPVRGGAKHRFETKTRVPKRSAALTRQKSPHRTTLRFAWDCPDIARNPRRAWRLRSGRF